MSESNPARRLLIVTGPQLDPTFEGALRQAAEAADFEMIICKSESEIGSLLDSTGWAYVIRQQRLFEDLKAEILFVRNFLPQIKQGRLVLISLNWLAHNRTRAILKRLGFAQVITAISLRPQALKVRLQTFLTGSDAGTGIPVSPILEPVHNPFLPARGNSFEMVEPLQLPENCWLLRKPEDVRIVQEQWIIDLVGPGPSAGVWTRRADAELNLEDGHSVWEWKAKKPEKLFFGENGSWIFWGKRPRFQDFHWVFISKNPQLSFAKQNDALTHVLTLNPDRKLLVPANSEIALQKWSAIHASVLNDYKLKVPAAVIQTPYVRFEKAQDQEIPWRDLMGVAEPEGNLPLTKTSALYQIQRGLAPKEKLFSRIANQVHRESYLRELMKTDSTAQIWTPGQQVRFNAQVINVSVEVSTLTLKIPNSIDPETIFGQLYVNLSYRRGSLFFTIDQRDIGFDGNHLIVKFPEDVYEVQRRNHFRLPLTEETGSFVRIGDRFYKMLNVSAGGMAFAADADDQGQFGTGTKLEKVSFEVGAVRIQCQAQVCWCKVSEKEPAGSNLTIGVKFRSIHPATQQALNLFVLEEGFEYLKEHLVNINLRKH